MASTDKVGEYIHFKYDNYLKYGLNHASSKSGRFTGGKNPPDISNILEKQRQIIKTQAQNIVRSQTPNKIATKAELEKIFNFFWPNPNNPTDQFNVLADKLKIDPNDLFNRILDTIKSTKFNKFDFDITENLGVENFNYKVPEMKKIGALKEDSSNIQWKAIDKRIGLLKSVVEKYSEEQELTKWRDEANKIIKEWDDLQKAIIRITKKGNQTIDIEKAHRQVLEDMKDGEGNFITRLNKTIAGVQRYSKIFLLGQLGELLPVVAEVCLNATTITTVDELLNDIASALSNPSDSNLIARQVGWNSSVALKRKEDFVVHRTQDAFQKIGLDNTEYFQHLGSTKISMLGTQDKVDVQITLKDGQLVNTSIKNYDLSNKRFPNISLLNGTDPMKYLIDYKIFLNHYLNIAPWRKIPSGSFTRSQIEQQFNDSVPFAHDIIEANRTLNFSLALMAIAGGILKSQTINNILQPPQEQAIAPFFVVNDNSGIKGHYKVYFVDDYIELLYAHFNTLEQYLNSSISKNLRLQMTYVNGHDSAYSNAYSRISELLMKFESLKLKLSVPKSILPEWYSMTP